MEGENDTPEINMNNRLGDLDLKKLLANELSSLSSSPEDSYAICWRHLGLTKHNAQRDEPIGEAKLGKPVQCLNIDKENSCGKFMEAMLEPGGNKPIEISAKGVTMANDAPLLSGTSLVWQCKLSETADMIETVKDLSQSSCASAPLRLPACFLVLRPSPLFSLWPRNGHGSSGRDPRSKLAAEHGIKGAVVIFRDGAYWEFGGTNPMDAVPPFLKGEVGGSMGIRSGAAGTATLLAVKKLGKMGKGKAGGSAA